MSNFLDDILGKAPPPSQLSDTSKPVSLLDEILPRIQEVPAGIPRITVTPAPPMSGFSPEVSDRMNAEGEQLNKDRIEPSVFSKAGSALALPVENYGKNIYEAGTSGLKMAGEGIDAFTSPNRQAEGIGKIGMGLMSAVASPVTAGIKTFVEEPVTQLTGSKEFGEKTGLITGLGIPVKGTQTAIKSLPKPQAIEAIIDTIGKDNLANVIAELKSNPRNSLMDVVPATRQMAQKLITTEGKHQNKFEKFITDRIGSSKSATADAFDATMGTPVNIVEKLDTMKKTARGIGKNEIEPAIANSGFVDVSKVINNIDAKLKPGVTSKFSVGDSLPLSDTQKPLAEIRKFIMDDKSVRVDPKSLHEFQSVLRAEADSMLNSQNPLDRRKGNALMNVRNDIVEAIDKASGGKYKPALAKYKDEMEIQNAFEMGKLITRNRLGRLEESPEFWEKWVKGASKEELEAAREGARLAVQHQIGGFKAGARKGQDIIESEFNRDKLSALFGKEEVDKMAKRLSDERNIAITNQHLIGGSQTAMRMKTDSHVDLPVEKPPSGVLPIMMAAGEGIAYMSGGIPGLASAGVMATRAAGKAKHKYVDLPVAKAKNNRITDLLTATGEDKTELIKILESHLPQPKQSLLSRSQNFALPVLPP